MWRWAGRVVLALSGAAVVVCLPVAALADSGTHALRDAQRVYCLSPAHRDELVEAAVTLGLARRTASPGRPDGLAPPAGPDTTSRTPEEWRHARPADFDRACAALVASAGITVTEPGGSGSRGVSGTLTALIPVVAGAVLAWAAGELRARGATASLTAGSMHTAATAYVRACHNRLRHWQRRPPGPTPPDDEVRDRKSDLDAEIRRVAGGHPGWRALTPLRAELDEITDRVLSGDWPNLTPDERDRAAGELRHRLDTFTEHAQRLTRALEHPWRRHREMRTGSSSPSVSAPSAPTGV